MNAEAVIEVEIDEPLLKQSKRIKEDKLTTVRAKIYDLLEQEKKLATDIQMITTWLYERK